MLEDFGGAFAASPNSGILNLEILNPRPPINALQLPQNLYPYDPDSTLL